MKIAMEKLNYVFELYVQLEKEEPDEQKAKVILAEKLRQLVNDPNFNPLDYGGSYD